VYGRKIGSSENPVFLRVRTFDIHSSENLIKQEKRSPYREIVLARSTSYRGQEAWEVW